MDVGLLPKLKLNIGAGSVRRPGFLSVDVRPECNPDIVSVAWDLAVVEEGSVQEIYSRHMLEHLDPHDAVRTIQRWFTVLAPGGSLNIIVPDLAYHARQILGAVKSSFADQEHHALASIYGWRDETRGGNREDAHRWGYTEETLCRLLRKAGFVHIARVLSGTDSEGWHLNLLAAKAA